MRRVRGAWDTFLSWHRGLPDPPGLPPMTLKLMAQTLRESNALYLQGWRDTIDSLRGWKTAAKEADDRARTGDAAAREMAGLVRSVSASAPQMMRQWLAPRLALAADAMLEFGRGFREGRAAPQFVFDIKSLLRDPPPPQSADAPQTEQQTPQPPAQPLPVDPARPQSAGKAHD